MQSYRIAAAAAEDSLADCHWDNYNVRAYTSMPLEQRLKTAKSVPERNKECGLSLNTASLEDRQPKHITRSARCDCQPRHTKDIKTLQQNPSCTWQQIQNSQKQKIKRQQIRFYE